jgi:hypothetical protein
MELVEKKSKTKVFENKLKFPETSAMSLVKLDQEFKVKFLSEMAKIIISNIAQLTNALSEIQYLNGAYINNHLKDELMKEVLKNLIELREEVKPRSFQGIEYLIKYYQGECNYKEYSSLLPYFLGEELLILCGPLATWHWKSDARKQSFILGVKHDNNLFSEEVDGLIISKIKDLMNDTGHEGLNFVNNIPDYRIYNLVSCAGEANTHPKHFSYFLPENLGVLHNPKNSTIVFQNVYEQIFVKLSLTLAPEFISYTNDLSSQEVSDTLLLWFRGHDCGHSLGFPETSYKKISDIIGYQNTMTVSECVADLYGFYIVNALAAHHNIPTRKTAFVHLAEMIRYLRRGLSKWYPDSDAAKIQFNYLVKNNFITINGNGKIEFDNGKFYEGVLAMIQELYPMVLKLDGVQMKLFLDKYLFDQTDEIKCFYENLNKFPLPFSFEYNFRLV